MTMRDLVSSFLLPLPTATSIQVALGVFYDVASLLSPALGPKCVAGGCGQEGPTLAVDFGRSVDLADHVHARSSSDEVL